MDELLATAGAQSTVRNSLVTSPRPKKESSPQRSRDPSATTTASNLTARKRVTAAPDGYAANIHIAPIAAISNPYPRISPTYRTSQRPAYLSALSNDLSRKIFPRKFARVRSSRTRLLAGIVFLVVGCFFLSRTRLRNLSLNVGWKNERSSRVLFPSRSLEAEQGASDADPPLPVHENVSESLHDDAVPRDNHSHQPQNANDDKMEHAGPSNDNREKNPNAAKTAPTDGSGEAGGPDGPESVEEANASTGDTQSHDVSSSPIRASAESKESPAFSDHLQKKDHGVHEMLRKKVVEHAASHVEDTSDEKIVHHEPKKHSGIEAHLSNAHPHIKTTNTHSGPANLENPWKLFSGSHGPYQSEAGGSGSVKPAVELWSHEHVITSHNYKFPFCRIYGACRTKSGRILLPKQLEQHKSQLARCGVLSHDNFVVGDAEQMKGFDRILSLPDGSETIHMDLVERHAPRRGAAHFFADSLKVLFFLDSIYGSGSEHSGPLSRMCSDGSGNSKNGSCAGPNGHEGVNPVMFVRKESFMDDSWVPNFLKLLASRGSVKGHTPFRFLDLYGIYPKWKTGTPEPTACFKSITTSTYLYGQIPPSALTAVNPFFSGNEIKRTKRSMLERDSLNDDESSQRSNGSGPVYHSCRVRVKISEHLRQELGPQSNQLAETLRSKTQHSQLDHMKLSVMLSLPQPEPTNFQKRISRLQETDILVAPHGSHLSDIVFLRTGAAVIEVHPFGYVSGMFQGLTRQMGVLHSKLTAEPDVTAFEACIRHANNAAEGQELNSLISKMKTGAKEYLKSGHSALQLEDGSQEHQSVKEIKLCARQQSMAINGEKLGDAIWTRAQALCTEEQNLLLKK